MAKRYVMETMLDAAGNLLDPGDDAPDESETNLAHYQRLGVIGTEEEYEERYKGTDIGRRGKASARRTRPVKPGTGQAAKPSEIK